MSTYDLVTAVLVAGLLAATVPIATRLAADDRDQRLFWLLMASAVLRFACTFLQTFVAVHAYHGVADFTGYSNRGMILGRAFRSGHFGLDHNGMTGTGAVDTFAGAVFAVIGSDEDGAFVVFSWIALLGLVAFYRAFRIAVPDGAHLRYAILIFLFPSLLFWSSAIGKEALMTGALGLVGLGAAKLLSGQRGIVPLLAGMILGAVVRPHEVLLAFLALFVGFVVRRRPRRDPVGALGKLAVIVVLVASGFLLLRVTAGFLHIHSVSTSTVSQELNQTNRHNTKTGAGFGSSNYHYSSSPLHYPEDAYIVLLDPLPFQAHSTTQLLASTENLAVLAVLVGSIRRIAGARHRLSSQPYVALALVYSLGFVYLFAALGNLGLLDRERTLLFPFLFVLTALPLGRDASSPSSARPKGHRHLRVSSS